MSLMLVLLVLWITGLVVWSSCPTANERLLRQDLREWRRQQRATWRAAHPVFLRGDLVGIPLLLGLAAAVIVLCR